MVIVFLSAAVGYLAWSFKGKPGQNLSTVIHTTECGLAVSSDGRFTGEVLV